MKDINYFYENPPEFSKFNDRKYKISSKKTILIGAINCGKTFIICDYLNSFKQEEFLYIDLSDIRLDRNLQNLMQNLSEFIKNNDEIKVLIIDNFVQNLNLENIEIENLILITRQNLNLQGFKNLKIYPLNFEEFIAFDKKRSEINSLFASFLLQGNGAKNYNLSPYEAIAYEQNILKSNYNFNEILILKECTNFLNQTFSANKIYTSLKQNFKISKDIIYSTISKFQNENLLVFIPKFQSESSSKKLYFSDFLMPDALCFKKDFKKKFSNALLCELLTFNEKIFYTKFLDFYIPSKNLAILIIPFSANELIFLKFKKIFSHLKELGISKLSVITMTNSGELKIEGIKCEIIPFVQFALSF